MRATVLHENLTELSLSLIELHRSLLSAEQRRQETGRSPLSAAGMLERAAFDPELGWLRDVSRLIVDIDERLNKTEPLSWLDATAFRRRVEERFGSEAHGVSEKLRTAVQERPEVAMGLGRVRLALAKLPTRGMAQA